MARFRREAKITSKGQITIPLEVRQRLGVRSGDTIVFEADQHGMRVKPVRKESPFAKYAGIGTPAIGSGKDAVLQWVRQMRGE